MKKAADAAGRTRLVTDASGYMAATYASQILAFGIGVLTKGLLGPTALGVWTILLSLLSFMNLLELGVIQATNKEVSYALSKGDEQAAEAYKRTQFSFVALTGLLGCAAVAGYAWLRMDVESEALLAGLLAVAVLLPFYQVHMGQVTIYWANHKFAATSLLIIFETALAGTIGLLLIWRVGLFGQVLSFAAILLVKLGVLAWQARGQPRLRIGFAWDTGALKRLLKVGVPLQIINLANVLKLSGTVFLIAQYFDAEAVGIYAFALSVQNFIYWTPNAFSIVMFPRFQERFAAANDQVAALHSYLVKPVIGLAFFLLPALISAAYFFVSLLVERALPAYKASISVLTVMLLGTFFLSLEHMPGQFLTTANRLWQRVGLSALSAVFLGICIAIAIGMHWGLLGVVAALSAANALSFLVAFVYAYALSGGWRAEPWLPLMVVGAFAYVIAAVAIVDRGLPAWQGSWGQDFPLAVAKWTASLVLMLPLFAYAQRELGLIQTLRQLIATRLGKHA